MSPWSVKGVEPEARQAAKIAARRAGVTVGQWLNKTIRAAAAEQLAGPSHPSAGQQQATPLAEQEQGAVSPSAPPTALIERTMRRLSDRLERIGETERATCEGRRWALFRRDDSA